jgi:hypothetical protein
MYLNEYGDRIRREVPAELLPADDVDVLFRRDRHQDQPVVDATWPDVSARVGGPPPSAGRV